MSSSHGSSSPIRSSPTRRSPRRRGGDGPSPASGATSSPMNYGSSPMAATPAGAVAGFGSGRSSSPLPYGTPGSNRSMIVVPGGTPRRRDVNADPQREVDLGPGAALTSDISSDMHRTSDVVGGRPSYLWGTDINVQQVAGHLRGFLNEFRSEADVPKYLDLIKQRVLDGLAFVDIDSNDIRAYDEKLYAQIVRYPTETIPIFDDVVTQKFREGDETRPMLQVRIFNLQKVSTMRDLNPEDLMQLVAVRGMIIRTSPIIPDCSLGLFRCSVCQNTVEVEVDHGIINEPSTCDNCSASKSMELIHNRCKFTNKQMIKIQETPEHVPDGQTPQTTFAYCFDTLVDAVQPGDKVEVTGIYQADRLRVNPKQRKIKSVFRTHLDVIHFKKTSSDRMLKDDEEDIDLDEATRIAQEREVIQQSERHNIQEILVKSLAPNIFQFEDVKRGVLAQLFGGANKKFKVAGRGQLRGEINILLCGDPGTSKSQLLQYAVKLAPRGLYTSGKGSSAVGLTAYVTKDPETRQIVLESGALVLCDGGICCIDEFDKMPDTTRVILHEAMEQQTISVAKAGIIATLNARTSILAAANPQDSRWNPKMSIVDNIQLPPTLLSRFDLIYLILDTPDRNKDRELANHIISLYYDESARTPDPELMSRDLLARYISYARRTYQPKLNEASSKLLVQKYAELRRGGISRKTVTATPRQLESLIRLSEANARMRFSDVVEPLDVEAAATLVTTALQQSATDPRTGMIDISLLTTGQSTFDRETINNLKQQVAKYMRDNNKSGTKNTLRGLLDDLREAFQNPTLPETDLRKALIAMDSISFNQKDNTLFVLNANPDSDGMGMSGP